MRTDDLDYHLPEELIAQKPADQRDRARLMVVNQSSVGGACGTSGSPVDHRHVSDLPALLRPTDLLVFNDTRVLPARFHARRIRTGGHVEGLFIEIPDPRNDATWTVLLRSGGRLQPGELLALLDLDEHVTAHELELLEQASDGSWQVRKHSEISGGQLLDLIGTMPLPPYIQRMRENTPFNRNVRAFDRQRYQTVYARQPGAVAAPTAGLHFTEPLLARLRDMGVQTAFITLHVGLGTFQPVRAATLEEHLMHTERFSVPPQTIAALKAARSTTSRGGGRRIIPVGTTTVRALESLPVELPDEGYTGQTNLLIQPGYQFRFADGLMTNFHLPRSTLLALVAALFPGGLPDLLKLYQQAIDRRYRFYSYGDAMLILPP